MYNDVKTFIESCDQKRNDDNIELYKDLIIEEFSEFSAAYYEHNEVEQLDACMDMVWVILGYCYMKNWNVEGSWNEVARSNLCKINPETGKVNKREDGKVLKPEGWTPPQLEQFIK
jgi:predicted HAD superfamily Cof-like phosphohydrolase